MIIRVTLDYNLHRIVLGGRKIWDFLAGGVTFLDPRFEDLVWAEKLEAGMSHSIAPRL